MSPSLTYSKNLLQLVLSPKNAWEDLREAELPPHQLMEKGFYPLLAIVAVTAMLNGLYGAAPYNYTRQLQLAITEVATLFASLMLARAAFETLLPKFAGCPCDIDRFSTVVIYCMSMMAVISVISNLVPTTLSLIWFLPAFVLATAWQAHGYLEVSKIQYGTYFTISTLVLVGLPTAIAWVLGMLLGTD